MLDFKASKDLPTFGARGGVVKCIRGPKVSNLCSHFDLKNKGV